jgi:hypothetical protein
MASHPESTAEPDIAQKKYKYPGLGHPLRGGANGYGYPTGGTREDGTESDLIYVRELAMMDVMDKLTDKPDWHKKVFDGVIVEKWKKEALAIPDDMLYKLSTAGKSSWGDGEDNLSMKAVDVLNERAFNYVRLFFSNWTCSQLTVLVY